MTRIWAMAWLFEDRHDVSPTCLPARRVRAPLNDQRGHNRRDGERCEEELSEIPLNHSRHSAGEEAKGEIAEPEDRLVGVSDAESHLISHARSLLLWDPQREAPTRAPPLLRQTGYPPLREQVPVPLILPQRFALEQHIT